MNKFWALLIFKDMTIKRMWMSSYDVLIAMQNPESKIAKVYRTSNDQEAILGLDTVTWKDVEQIEKVG